MCHRSFFSTAQPVCSARKVFWCDEWKKRLQFDLQLFAGGVCTFSCLLLLSDQVKGVSGGVNVWKLLPFNVCTCEPVFSCLLVMYINRTRVWKETSAALKAQQRSSLTNHKQNEETHFCACAFFQITACWALRTSVQKCFSRRTGRGLKFNRAFRWWLLQISISCVSSGLISTQIKNINT